jgi:glutamate N-acetyltransferase/amino-acid N-acetyltransferase
VLLATFDPGTVVAGVLTRSLCPSAPVDWCRAGLKGGSARALLVNSGNANAFTGTAGRTTVESSAATVSRALGCTPGEVFLASTGVIGEPLDAGKFEAPVGDMAGRLAEGPWLDAAKAIMTTDTFPKVASRRIEVDGRPVAISGIAKGSGMIAPDMATMLSFVFTDMAIAAPALQAMLQPLIDRSFNAITVDSDTSTSDTCLVFATGRAGNATVTDPTDARAKDFAAALGEVLRELAIQVVRDGEGATKAVAVTVEGAVNDLSARRIALSIANSPLVKTAIAGGDANWGRVVMAVGKAGEPADRDRLSIAFGDIVVAEAGQRAAGYDEAAASAYMGREELEIRVGIGLGAGRATVYTCDLTHGYISINGDYRS